MKVLLLLHFPIVKKKNLETIVYKMQCHFRLVKCVKNSFMMQNREILKLNLTVNKSSSKSPNVKRVLLG